MAAPSFQDNDTNSQQSKTNQNNSTVDVKTTLLRWPLTPFSRLTGKLLRFKLRRTL